MRSNLVKLSLIALFSLSSQALAAWKLDNQNSNLSFVSVKKSTIAEVHSFTKLTGKVSEQGVAKIIIDLTSVETNIPIRNERMQQHLFETSSFSSATIESQFSPDIFNKLSKQDSILTTLTFTLTLHGKQQSLSSKVRVSEIDDRIVVSSMQPVIVNAAQFDLVNGIEKLRALASLPSIATAVPVSFNLSFVKK